MSLASKRVQPAVKVRSEPPALSKSVVLLPVASARSSLLVEFPSSSSPIGFVRGLPQVGDLQEALAVAEQLEGVSPAIEVIEG